MTNLQTEWANAPIVSDLDLFRSQLSNVKLLDIGIITAILQNGRVTVEVQDATHTQLECEALTVGNLDGQLIATQPGQYCMVVLPMSSLILATNEVYYGEMPYSKTHAKCIPITVTQDNAVKLSVLKDALMIGSSVYTVDFQNDSISFTSQNGQMSIDLVSGEFRVGNAASSVELKADGSVAVQIGAAYQKGELQSTKCAISIDKDGAVSITNGTNATVAIDKDGKITLTTETLTIKGDVEITGNLKAANGNFTAEK